MSSFAKSDPERKADPEPKFDPEPRASDVSFLGADPVGAETHEVLNQPAELVDYNLFSGDRALREAVTREGAGLAFGAFEVLGARMGAAAFLELGVLANKHAPELETHDRYGRRINRVNYHPAYHALMDAAIGEGLQASPWTAPGRGAHVARAARFYLQTQVEAGHLCPITMTFAASPVLARQADLAAVWLPKIHACLYDPLDAPISRKHGATIGMAMTEKQGGSDVRANTTRAVGLGNGAYSLVGHKYFVSAPMSDAFLVLAHAPGGLSCFLMPRWRPDGTRNALQIMRLKRKMGNVANATGEVELRGAMAWMVGPEGRGIATILEMVALTRFDCMIGSAAGMRIATAQAIDHCRQRKAFGEFLIDQPLMQNVLADLAIESEAALVFAMRVARALDSREEDFARIAIPLGKYRICKQTPAHAYEAMECLGGSGFMEDSPMPRLYREAPVNAIWEGSGNVQCLDLLRVLKRTPDSLEACLAEVEQARGGHHALDRHLEVLKADVQDMSGLESGARDFADRLSCALQGALLVQHAPPATADAFCRSRLESGGRHLYGALPRDVNFRAIVDRAAPR
jgi:putative acyl-CoA dehydrogenase